MVNIIENKTYFFLTKSVFEVASKNSSNNSSKFLLKCVLIKILHRDKINPHLIFFISDEIENIKTEFGEKFHSLMQIGENMFCPEYNPTIKGHINQRTLSYATDKNGEIPYTDKVKIVCADNITKAFFDKEISEHNYPVGTFSIEEALEELAKIESEFIKGNVYFDSDKKDVGE
jgi:hypothetical protein